MRTLEALFDHDAALVFGIGGGGDVVSTVPTARLLEDHGVAARLGGVAWERFVVDPTPGPRGFDDIAPIEVLSDSVGLITGESRTHDGIEFAETAVARYYNEPTALIGMGGGPTGVARGLDAGCEALGVDLLVGIDAGGDVLAAGDEPGLRSPLVDAVMLAALVDVEVDVCLGVFGYGSDGELTRAELDDGVARAAERGGLLGAWGLTPRVTDELEGLLETVTTEASRLPVEAARGQIGTRSIREGSRSVELTPASAITFYFDPPEVAATSALHRLVSGTDSLEAANDALESAGYDTEYTLERRLAAQRD